MTTKPGGSVVLTIIGIQGELVSGLMVFMGSNFK